VALASNAVFAGDGGTEAGSAADDAGATDMSSDAAAYDGMDGGYSALSGARVCAYLFSAVEALGGWVAPPESSALSCVTSGSDGTFVIPSVPVRTNMVLTITKTGFISDVLSIQTASSPMDVRQYPIFVYETATGNFNPVPNVTIDWQNKGQLLVFDVGLGDGGASVVMGTGDDASPPSGVGPVYEDTNGDWVPSATMFYPARGALGISLAQYFNVPAGVYTLTMQDMSDDCEPSLMPFSAWGFPLVTPKHSIQALVLDGFIAGVVGFICTPMTTIVAVDGG
jgi:hypothetical protein